MATEPNKDGINNHNHKRVLAFKPRKNNTKKNKNKKNKNKRKSKKQNETKLRINKNDSNYGFNNDLSDAEETEIYNSLLKAVSNNNKLTDSELMKVFQNALSKLNGAWFRHNLPLFFIKNDDKHDIGDIVLFIVRLFVLNFDLKRTKHNVPFRYMLLDLIAPSLHHRNKGHKTVQLLEPTPQITKYHRSYALNVFNLWILELTQHIAGNNKDDSLVMLNKYPHKTLLYLTTKEMECLFEAFALKELLSKRIKDKLCDKIYDLLHNDHNAAAAVEWSIYFDLMHDIPYNILLIPLLCDQSLLHYAMHYVDSIERNTNNKQDIHQIKEFIVLSIAKLMEENKTNITASRAIKLLSLWKFDIKQKAFEPFVMYQIKNFLKWIIIKGHIDDYAAMVCSHSQSLKYFVIKQCHKHPSTYKSCIKWAKHWGLEEDDICCDNVKYCKEWIIKNEWKPSKEVFINGFDDIDYYSICESQIIFVNNMDTLNRAKDVLLDDSVDCIGLDLELMSVELIIPSIPKHCQILQISTADIAFIFDLQCMNNDLFDCFDELLTQIFSESLAVKIGIGWDGDLRNLRKEYPDSIAFKSVCSPYLDLSLISRFMKNDPEFKEKISRFDNYKIDDGKEKKIKMRFKKTKDKEGGLAKIVRFVLNKKLNKFEQLSNWSNRPLRIQQLKYAALDAMVECHLYHQLKQWEKDTILPDLNGFFDNLYGN